MPTPIYRAELSWDGVQHVGAAPSAVQNGTRGSLFLSAQDDFHQWGVEARIALHAYSSGPVLYEHRAEFYFYTSASADPNSWSFVAGTFSLFEADGNNAAAITSGGMFAIEKDFDLDELRFVTPLGTVTKVLSTFSPPASDNSKMRPLCYGAQMFQSDGTGTSQLSFDAYNFYGKENGVAVMGSDLSAAAPGIWLENEYGTPPFYDSVSIQETSRYQIGFQWDNADGVRNSSRKMRCWNGADNIPIPGLDCLDMVSNDELGMVWRVAVDEMEVGSPLTVWRSWRFNADIIVWYRSTVSVPATPPVRCASIAFDGWRLWSLWLDGTTLYLANSKDAGLSWSSPVSVSITGAANPRLIVSEEGWHFYFYIDGGGDLLLERSGDFGNSLITGGPILVIAGVGPQTIAATYLPDRSLLIGYVAGGTWFHYRSRDYGLTWSAV